VCFTESIQTQIAAAEALPDAISRAAMTLVQSLLNGNKILCCGNGTSAANAQHFAASMINRFETERPSLPAIALNTDNVVLTAIANDRLHDEIYAKQVRALGHAGDVLLAISTRGNSRDIVKAVEAAVTRDMTNVACRFYLSQGTECASAARLATAGDFFRKIPQIKNSHYRRSPPLARRFTKADEGHSRTARVNRRGDVLSAEPATLHAAAGCPASANIDPAG
jgi:DnaA initiator-associating protein